jgi:hypothetical protein
MIYLMKNKILNIIIAIVATLSLLFINTSQIFLIRITVKIFLPIILIMSIYHMKKYKHTYNNNLIYILVILAFLGIFILNPASKHVAGKWVYKEERVLDGIYKMEIKEDSTFITQIISKKTENRVLYESTPGKIKVIKNGNGIAKENFLIQFNLTSANSNKIVQKYLVFNEYSLIPPPVDLDYGDYDYFPFTPVNDFEGKWERE